MVFCALLIFGALTGLLFWDMNRSPQQEVLGAGRSVPQEQAVEDITRFTIDEPLYSFTLPPDWKLKAKVNSPREQSVSWRATKKGEDNRTLILYIDTIPADLAVNRLLPVEITGDSMSHGQISDNCANFTLNSNPQSKMPLPAKWQHVDFICDVPNFVQNKVGVGAVGPLNTLSIKGPTKDMHRYFLIYTDHNIQPDYTILYNAIRSFKAK